MMEITPENSPNTQLFHTINKQQHSDNVVTFTFRPENKSEARTIVARLVPHLRDEGHQWFLKMFSTEAQQRHATAHWDSTTRQVFSKEEAELAEFLAANDKLDLTDEPTLEKPTKQSRDKPGISIEILIFVPQNFSSMNNEDDSVSTFWTSTQLQTPTVPIANLKDP